MKQSFLTIVLLISNLSYALAQRTFTSLDALLAYSSTKSISMQSNDIRLLQAKKAQLAAIIGIADPQANISGSFLNNTQLPVNLFPAEIFGGQKGEFREVQTGVKYNTSSAQSLDIKLLNLEAWQNLKLSKINIEITETDNKLNQKSLYENIASTYYNIVQLNAQLESTKQNLLVADTLLQVTENKYKQGIAKQQDINESRVNQLTIKENINQIAYLIKQHYLSLKILIDIPQNEEIEIIEQVNANPLPAEPNIKLNDLLVQSYLLKQQSALTNLQKTKRSMAPTLSFVANNSFNQYNNEFTVFGGKWITSNYVGLKLNFVLPNANTISNQYKAQYDYQLAQKNTEQARIKSDLTYKQLETDWSKAISQQKSHAEILAIQQDTYQKNKNLYNEGLQSIDRTLSSFNAMLNANYSLIASTVSVLLAQSKIDINNKLN